MSVNSKTSDVVETEKAVRDLLAAFAAGDVERLLAHYPEDGLTYVDMSEPDSVLRTRAEIGSWVEEFGTAFDISAGGIDVLSLTAQENRVAAELRIRATYIGEGAPGGGKAMELRFCVIYGRIEDGVVFEERVYAEPVESQITRALEQ